MNQLYVYVQPLLPEPPSHPQPHPAHPGHHRARSWAPVLYSSFLLANCFTCGRITCWCCCKRLLLDVMRWEHTNAHTGHLFEHQCALSTLIVNWANGIFLRLGLGTAHPSRPPECQVQGTKRLVKLDLGSTLCSWRWRSSGGNQH